MSTPSAIPEIAMPAVVQGALDDVLRKVEHPALPSGMRALMRAGRVRAETEPGVFVVEFPRSPLGDHLTQNTEAREILELAVSCELGYRVSLRYDPRPFGEDCED